MRLALWTGNVLAVTAFTGLLALTLARYCFDPRVSAGLAFAFVAINVPVLRTLVYGQVNLHVANLILLALLAYPRLPAWSALALALAVHLKTSPVVLVLPFVTEKNWRWAAAFAAWLAAVAAAIYAAHGVQPCLDFLRNARGVYEWTDLSFRENSIDSFLRSTAALVGGPLSLVGRPPVRLLAKASVLALALAAAGTAIRRGAFVTGRGAGSHVQNGWPALAVLMVLASPLVWEHHPVFTALPFLVVTRKLRTPGEWAAFSLAYCIVYLLPTFDFYPWSFGRLAGLLTLLVLLHRTSAGSGDGDVFRLLHERLGGARIA
jgi:hypothetical protein